MYGTVAVVAVASAFGWWWVWQCASSTLVPGGLGATPLTAALVAMVVDGI